MSHLKTHLEYIRNNDVSPALLLKDWCPDLRREIVPRFASFRGGDRLLLTLEGEQIATGKYEHCYSSDSAEQP